METTIFSAVIAVIIVVVVMMTAMMMMAALHPPECHARLAVDDLQFWKIRMDFRDDHFLKWHADRDICIRTRQRGHLANTRRIRLRTQASRQHRMCIDGPAADAAHALQLRPDAHEHDRPPGLRRARQQA